ncbi:cupin domain-containing protein [Bradyrhizobium sp. CCBAU 53421]|uniref:cupin domain-containing protein n=1 Tax=Bradyrhizobium sp. CCBAU 53421 TaxID=1325120 RepID=UPI00188C0C2E|nr:cupin domain-containing protein [Bradyrhizobium sp. CCBAU 53421]QOZ36877.1 cupin domain-containing protein [Bradyrhizobium sp. CCBAU 53421]
MTKADLTRRDVNRASLLSLLAAIAAACGADAAAQAQNSASSRREVIRQALPGDPRREISLVEVHYPPGTGSPAHAHANGVMAFVVSGSISSQVGEGPEQTYKAGDAWWEPAGAVHRVSRNPSATVPATLLAIYIAPEGATAADLMKPL